MREKVIKGWVVVAKLPKIGMDGETRLVPVSVSRRYASKDAADQFLSVYRKVSDAECWVESKSGYETRKGAPEPLI